MNINSTYFNRTLRNNMEKLTTFTNKLSTGKRINSASDDASGLQISTRMTAQNRGNTQAIRNTKNGISLLQTADGSLATIQDMLQRIRELSIQGKNDTYSTEQKQSIQNEILSLTNGINQITKNTNFNGIYMLSQGESIGLNGVRVDDQRVEIKNIPVNTEQGAKTTVQFWMYWDGSSGVMPFAWDNAYDIYITGSKIGVNTGVGDVLGTTFDGKDKWSHISVTFINGQPNADNTELYINGERKTLNMSIESSREPRNLNATSTVYLGSLGYAPLYHYGGGIDELKIWDGVRTEEQIKNDMYSTTPKNEENLLGYWKFDEEMLKDETLNGNEGKFINGASLLGNGVSQSISIHTGSESANQDNMSFFNVSDETLNLKHISLDDTNLIKKIDNAINAVSIQRGEIGSKINRYEFKIDNLHNTIINTKAAQMRIEDLDMASAMSELTKSEILMKATQQMLKINNSMYEQKMQMLFN